MGKRCVGHTKSMESTTNPSKEQEMSQQSKSKPETIHVAHLTWETPEYEAADGTEVAHVAGYVLEIAPHGKRWVYEARTTSEVSEAPEIVTAGEAASRGGALRS